MGSNDETIDHLETLFRTKSLQDEAVYNYLHSKLEILENKSLYKGVDNTDWASSSKKIKVTHGKSVNPTNDQ